MFSTSFWRVGAVLALLLVAPSGVAQEEAVEREPAALAPGPEGSVYACGLESGAYWYWRIGADGAPLWQKSFPVTRQDDPLALLPAADGGFLAFGGVFLQDPEPGYRPFLEKVDRDGASEHKAIIEIDGIPHTMVSLGKGGYLIGGSKFIRSESGGKTVEERDAWLLRVNEKGAVDWQRTLDHAKAEDVYSIVPAPDGGFYCQTVSGNLDKFGSGPAEIWLFHCDAQGKVVKEATLPDGRVASRGGGFLVQSGERLAAVCSLPQSHNTAGEDSMTFPVRLVCYTLALEPVGQLDVADHHSLGTPPLEAAPNGTFLLATAGEKGVILSTVNADGKKTGAIAAEGGFGDETMLDIVDVLAVGDTAYVLGSATDLATDDMASKAFLIKFDLAARKVLWQRAYE